MAINPLTLASMGLGTAGSLYSGIRSIAEAPARKRRFLNDARREAQITALRNQRHTNFFPTNALDAKYKADAVAREARENPAFQADPAAFVPFLVNATSLAGGIYDFANEPAEPKEFQLPAPPETLTYFNPAKAASDAKPAYEELHYRDPGAWNFGASRQRRWWED